MNAANKNLLIRAISGFGLLGPVVWLVVTGGWAIALLTGVASALCTAEYYQMTMKRLSPMAWIGIASSLFLPFLTMLTPSPERAMALAFGVVVFIFYLSQAFHLHLEEERHPEAPVNTAHMVTGLLYGGVAMLSLAAIRNYLPDGTWWLVSALVITWANDTAAYFAGRFFGHTPLLPRVSPKKTWEGFAGGMVGSIGGLIVVKSFFYAGMTWVDCFILGALGGILGPTGDLCASMLKRACGVKDSGKVIPGHGGLIDRVDALIFNAPLVWIYVSFFR